MRPDRSKRRRSNNLIWRTIRSRAEPAELLQSRQHQIPSTPTDRPNPESSMNLTPRQLDVIVAIRNYRHLHGYSPTMQELADQLGTSKVTIFEHVGALEKKRVLRRDKHKARSLEITADGRLPDEDRATKLPLLGAIAAGSPIEAVENREELDLEQMFQSRNGVYVLKVRGDSMIDEHLC